MQQVSFAQNLRNILNLSGMTQRELAKKVEISPGSISNYCQGKEQPSLSNLVAIAGYLDVSLDHLVYGVEVNTAATADTLIKSQTEKAALRIDTRIDRQTRLISDIGNIVAKQISSAAKNIYNENAESLDKINSSVIFEDDVWDLEMCSFGVAVAYPTTNQNIDWDETSQTYVEGEYFSLQVDYLRKDKYSKYIEYYSSLEGDEKITAYIELMRKHCSDDELKRLKIKKANFPIPFEIAVFSLDVTKLKVQFPVLHKFLEESIVGDKLALVIAPQHIADLNLVANDEYFHYVTDYFKYLDSHSKLFGRLASPA